MATSNRRRSSIKILPPKVRISRPVTLAEEDAQLRERIYKLENSVAYTESYLSNADSWRKKRRLPASAEARRKRQFTQIAIEVIIAAIMVSGLLSFVWQRFLK